MAGLRDAALRTSDGGEHGIRDRLSIGRDPQSDVRLDARSVSRRHAVLVWADDRWCIEDVGSANGTFVNAVQIPAGVPHPLRHGDSIRLGLEELVFSWPAEGADPDRTQQLEEVAAAPEIVLSPFQRQVVQALCGAWLSDTGIDQPPSNREIAASLGTPEAVESVKAALRRVYAKAGISGLPVHAKRRALYRLARQRGWLAPR